MSEKCETSQVPAKTIPKVIPTCGECNQLLRKKNRTGGYVSVCGASGARVGELYFACSFFYHFNQSDARGDAGNG